MFSVEQGIADVGIVGSDILNGQKYNINKLLDLPFGKCHFALAKAKHLAIKSKNVIQLLNSLIRKVWM